MSGRGVLGDVPRHDLLGLALEGVVVLAKASNSNSHNNNIINNNSSSNSSSSSRSSSSSSRSSSSSSSSNSSNSQGYLLFMITVFWLPVSRIIPDNISRNAKSGLNMWGVPNDFPEQTKIDPMTHENFPETRQPP